VTKTIHADAPDWRARVLTSETADEQGYELIVSRRAAGDWTWSVRTTADEPAPIASGSARTMSGATRAACSAAYRELLLAPVA
jgi:hypothetical protein